MVVVSHCYPQWKPPVFLDNTEPQAGQESISLPETGMGNMMGAPKSIWVFWAILATCLGKGVALICILTSGFESCRSLNLVAIDMKTVVMN